MSRIVLLAGGSPHAHDFDASGAALATVLSAGGHDVDTYDDPDEVAAVLDAARADTTSPPVDALAVIGLWWQMNGDAYDSWREKHAYSTPTSTRRALSSFVEGGGGLLAMHTTPICFDDWPEWADVVGGGWRWGVSSHPPPGPVHARVVDPDHPVVKGSPAVIELHDEVYGDLDVREGVEVLAVARRQPDDDEQPVVWAHRFGGGRVVFDGFGHDVASILQPDHSRLIEHAISWILEGDA